MLSENIKKWLLVLVGTLCWSLTMVKSGLLYAFGLGFWGPNGHDGIWHLAISQSLSQFSLENPVFAGNIIKNYHLGFDAILAALHIITRVPLSALYFQILPPIFALLIGFLTYRYTKNLWSVFFVYFGGSLGYFFGGGESHFWAQQSISTLINPPYALSLILLLSGLLAIKNQRTLVAIVCFALLPQIKIYAGILAFSGLFVSSLRQRHLIKIIIPSAILAAIIYLPLNWGSSSLIVFRPFWFLQTLFSPDRLDWPRFFSALQTNASGHVLLKGSLAYTLALAIFLIGNFSTRLIFLKSFRLRTWQDSFFLTVILLGIIFPLLFVQTGTAWNTIQFSYYSLFSASLYAGFAMSKISKLSSLIIVLLTLPTTYFTLQNYLPNRPPAKVSHAELAALYFLSQKPKGIVYTTPFDKSLADAAVDYPPRPLYLYESTAYVAVFSGQPVFLADTVNLNITGYDWTTRQRKPLPSDNIKYSYLTSNTPFPNTHLIYSNSEVFIYEAD